MLRVDRRDLLRLTFFYIASPYYTSPDIVSIAAVKGGYNRLTKRPRAHIIYEKALSDVLFMLNSVKIPRRTFAIC